MAENIEDIFNKVTKNIDKDDSIILKFFKHGYNVLNTLSKTLGSLTSKIKLPKSVKDLNSKISSVFKDMKDIISPSKDNTNAVKDTDTNMKPIFSKLFKSSPQEGNAPPNETNKEDTKNSISNILSEIFGKEKKRNPFKKLKDRMDKRKEEVAKEKEANKTKKGKSLSITSILTSILTKLASLATATFGIVKPIVSGMTKGIFGALGWVSKKILSGLGPLLLKSSKFLIKSLSSIFSKVINFSAKNIAKGSSSLIKGGLKLGGKIISKTAGFAIKNTPKLLATGGSILGRAALTLASGPVGVLVAVGTALYGGYKLYKYLTRNNIDNDIYGKLTLLRLYAYGFNEPKKEHYSKVFDLEMIQKDFVIKRKNGIDIKKLDQETLDKIYDIFSVDVSNKEQIKIFNTWYLRRFLPAFKSFIEPLYNINGNIYLDSLDSLKDKELEEYVSNLRVPFSIYSINSVPTYEDIEIYVTKDQYDELLINIINQINKTIHVKKDIDLNEVIKENKTYANRNKIDQSKIDQIVKSQREKYIEKTNSTSNKLDINKMPLDPSSEGENELKKPDEEKVSSQKVSKINIAGGDLFPGGTNLEGITTRLPKDKIYNLDPNIRELFTGMAKEFHTVTGKKIPVTQAYRSSADQRRLYRQNPKKAAPPGRSLHEFGLAIDIDSRTANELDKLGLMKKYGFTRPVSGEWWHVEPIGISLNPTYYRDNPSERLEAIQSSIGKGGGGYAIESRKGKMKRPARNISYQKEIFNSKSAKVIEESTKPLNKLSKVTSSIPVKEDKNPTEVISPVKSNKPTNTNKPIKLTSKNTEDYETKPVSISSTSDTNNSDTNLITKPKEQDIQKETKKTINLYKASNFTTTNIKDTEVKKLEQVNNTIQIDTKNMETMMSKQVDVLSQIASILTGIDGKIDLDKIAKLSNKSINMTSHYKDISPSKNSVDLRSSKIT